MNYGESLFRFLSSICPIGSGTKEAELPTWPLITNRVHYPLPTKPIQWSDEIPTTIDPQPFGTAEVIKVADDQGNVYAVAYAPEIDTLFIRRIVS